MGSGVSLSLDGTKLSVSALGHKMAEKIRLYEFKKGEWVQMLLDLDEQDYEFFRTSVSLTSDGNRIAVVAIPIYAKLEEYPSYIRIYDLK